MDVFEDDAKDGSDAEAESMTAAEVLKTLEEVRISYSIAQFLALPLALSWAWLKHSPNSCNFRLFSHVQYYRVRSTC